MDELLLNFAWFMIMSWRTTTALIVSALLATGLSLTIRPFTGPYVIAMVLFGLFCGFWWHSRAMDINALALKGQGDCPPQRP